MKKIKGLLKTLFGWAAVVVIAYVVGNSGIQFPPWVISAVVGAAAAWVVLSLWREQSAARSNISGIPASPTDDMPSREYADRLLQGTPIDAKHAVPTLPQDGWGINDSLRRFFEDFDWFGIVANDFLPIKESPWRLQELPDTELDTLSDDSPNYGRRYHIFYNKERVGLLEITDYLDYTDQEPRILATIGIGDARLFSYDQVVGFMSSIAALLSGSTPEEYQESQCRIERALTAAQWDAARGKLLYGLGEVEVEVTLGGTSAAHYLAMRERRRQPQPRATRAQQTRQ